MIIGLVGKKGSGKDTVANFLVKSRKFHKRAFADPLKKVIEHLFLVDAYQLHDPILKETIDERWQLSPRQMMQKVGTDMVREKLGEDFWLKHMELSLPQGRNCVISDVRFQNEADWIKKKGGILIRIQSDDASSIDSHQSEMELENIKTDYVIPNEKRLGLDTFHEILEIWFSLWLI